MTEKQKRFVDAFIETGDTLEAAIRAGYSPAHAQRVKRQPGVKSYIAQRIAEAVITRMTSSDEILEYYVERVRKDGGTSIHINSVEQLAECMGYFGTTDDILALRALCRAYLRMAAGEPGRVRTHEAKVPRGDSRPIDSPEGGHAYWILRSELDLGCADKECSNCGRVSLISSYYCHSCGCRMDEASPQYGDWDDD